MALYPYNDTAYRRLHSLRAIASFLHGDDQDALLDEIGWLAPAIDHMSDPPVERPEGILIEFPRTGGPAVRMWTPQGEQAG